MPLRSSSEAALATPTRSLLLPAGQLARPKPYAHSRHLVAAIAHRRHQAPSIVARSERCGSPAARRSRARRSPRSTHRFAGIQFLSFVMVGCSQDGGIGGPNEARGSGGTRVADSLRVEHLVSLVRVVEWACASAYKNAPRCILVSSCIYIHITYTYIYIHIYIIFLLLSSLSA
jgi:hypothetical protein